MSELPGTLSQNSTNSSKRLGAQQLNSIRLDSKRVDSKLLETMAKEITHRQIEVLELIQSGYRNKQIADILCISESTVKSHVKALFQALYASNRFECVRIAQQSGLLQSQPRQLMLQNNRG